MKKMSTNTLTIGAVLTAIVFVLQLVAVLLRFLGIFAPSLVLVPIVIGAALCGVSMSTWLGFVFAVSVLVSGDAASFLAVDVFGTIATVILKGIAAGFFAGVIYKAFAKINKTVGVVASAIICPVVNTGVFLLGCLVFFMDTLRAWGEGMGFDNVFLYMIVGLVGTNFIFELALNMILSPAIVRLLNIKELKKVK